MQDLKRKLIFAVLGVISLNLGCASPTVIQRQQVGDENLSCQQLVQAISEAKRFEDDARHERGATGTNVAAALFFWP